MTGPGLNSTCPGRSFSASSRSTSASVSPACECCGRRHRRARQIARRRRAAASRRAPSSRASRRPARAWCRRRARRPVRARRRPPRPGSATAPARLSSAASSVGDMTNSPALIAWYWRRSLPIARTASPASCTLVASSMSKTRARSRSTHSTVRSGGDGSATSSRSSAGAAIWSAITEQRALGQEGARGLHRQAVGFVPVRVVEVGDASLDRRRDPRRVGDRGAQLGAAPSGGDRDLADADRLQHRQRPLDQRDATDGGQTVRTGVIADGDPFSGRQDQRAGQHLDRLSRCVAST